MKKKKKQQWSICLRRPMDTDDKKPALKMRVHKPDETFFQIPPAGPHHIIDRYLCDQHANNVILEYSHTLGFKLAKIKSKRLCLPISSNIYGEVVGMVLDHLDQG
mmetsp:Transcript_7616/g.10011  ORF Transcript_7616/g.10011 Transcript_7616/m.10011 type:complete len:105 (+) Transcript_7616:33-347(+)